MSIAKHFVMREDFVFSVVSHGYLLDKRGLQAQFEVKHAILKLIFGYTHFISVFILLSKIAINAFLDI
jgi:hypothetical protein